MNYFYGVLLIRGFLLLASGLVTVHAYGASPCSQQLFERIRPSMVEVLTKPRGNEGAAAGEFHRMPLKPSSLNFNVESKGNLLWR